MNNGFENIYAKAEAAMAPLSELAEFGFDAFDKGLQFQAELLGDAIELFTDEMKLLSSATSPTEYFQGQVEVAQTCAGRAQKRLEAVAAAATEAQGTFATWAERGLEQAQSTFGEAFAAAQAAAPKPSGRKAA
ncbi:MAG: phasin family protein [Gammaproteobacteria bacterium]|jgi:hypothetical protein